MKLKIESDGTMGGTRVVEASTGEPVEGVREVTWDWERGYPARVRISFDGGVAADFLLTLSDRIYSLD